jgi:hypothetical protein
MILALSIALSSLAAAPGAEGSVLSRLAGDFRSENGIVARHRLLDAPALGEVLFLDWRDAQDQPLRRRLLRAHRDERGETLEIVLFRDASGFAELDRRPLLLAALEGKDLRFLPEGCRIPVEARGEVLALILEEGRCRLEEDGAIELSLEWLVTSEGFEFSESSRQGEGGSAERLPAEGRLRFRRVAAADRGGGVD